MRRKIVQPPVDALVARLAGGQHGLVTLDQLAAAGLGGDAVARRVRAGRLHRIYRGVFAVGHARLSRKGRLLAAVLASGDRAALSHRSAAMLWGLVEPRGPRIDVTVPRGGGRARRGAVVVHRSALPGTAVTVRDAIPVTTPARTLIDLADVSQPRTLERALDEAHYLRLDLAGLAPIPGRRGAGRLTAVIARHEPGSTRTRTEIEELMLDLCRRAGLPQPLVNARIQGFEVDFAWPQAWLIVETDGWQAHRTRRAFERDRARDAALTAAGWRVIRITWLQLLQDPDGIADKLRRLAAGPARFAA